MCVLPSTQSLVCTKKKRRDKNGAWSRFEKLDTFPNFLPYGFQNATKSQISAIADNLGCFYVGNLSNGINFKTFLSIGLPQVNKVKMAPTTTSKQLCLLLGLAKPALMAKLSASIYFIMW